MYRSLYLSEEENEWVKENGEGCIRELIQGAMGSGDGTMPKVIKTKKQAVKQAKAVKQVNGTKGDGLHTCKICGYQLPYYKGKCLYCKTK